MSVPGKMKTGINMYHAHDPIFPETFSIIYLVLGAILRRYGFKDSVVYAEHNSILTHQDLFDSGVLFNLFSQYGVGKKLEPLIKELFTTGTLDPDINFNNVFFNEIVKLTPIVSKVVREHDVSLETEWLLHYAMSTVYIIDDIDIERTNRLKSLLEHNYDSSDSDSSEGEISDNDSSDDNISDNEVSDDVSEDNISDNEVSDNTICACDFCCEFKKYHNPNPYRNVSGILNDVLVEISKMK